MVVQILDREIVEDFYCGLSVRVSPNLPPHLSMRETKGVTRGPSLRHLIHEQLRCSIRTPMRYSIANKTLVIYDFLFPLSNFPY